MNDIHQEHFIEETYIYETMAGNGGCMAQVRTQELLELVRDTQTNRLDYLRRADERQERQNHLAHFLERRDHPFVIFIVHQQRSRFSSLGDDHGIAGILDSFDNLLRLILQCGDGDDCFHTFFLLFRHLNGQCAKLTTSG